MLQCTHEILKYTLKKLTNRKQTGKKALRQIAIYLLSTSVVLYCHLLHSSDLCIELSLPASFL